MRLIDADALADALFEKRKNYPQWVAETIGNMPEAVIQCKHCILRFTEKCALHDQAFPINKGDNWFCADGERK